MSGFGLVVGEAEVAEAARVAGDAGDELVVVLGGLVVLAGRALLAVDLVGEEVERAGVVPGPKSESSVSGKLGSISLRFLTFDLSQSFLSCSVVRQSTVEVLVGHDRDAVVGDLDLAVLDAALLADRDLLVVLDRARGVEMSVSPAQNFSKPPPVPDWPTVIWTFGCSSLNSSAAAWANGKTVEEPSIADRAATAPRCELARTLAPLRRVVSSSPHAATPSASDASEGEHRQ